ncbi:MAG: DUF2617 family protein [Phycisphaeraceae bacterium]|nr:DUF2617 family protein [Phycisphaeraceae bacterium]
MSVSHKASNNVQFFRMILFNRALHPELFNLQARRTFRQDRYEVESWIFPAGHVIRFAAGGESLVETVIEKGDHLPEKGLIYALPCLGEKDYELEKQDGPLNFMTTIQTETLSDNLYTATFREIRQSGSETNALFHEWQDAEGTPCLSLLDAQRFRKEYHVQSYHLLGGSGVVLRTQSIFEVR